MGAYGRQEGVNIFGPSCLSDIRDLRTRAAVVARDVVTAYGTGQNPEAALNRGPNSDGNAREQAE